MALADAIDERYRSFVILAGFSGMRLGELLALRWENVNLLRRQVTVADTLTDLAGRLSFGSPKTRAAVRIVTVPEFGCQELSRIAVTPVDPLDLVFRSPDGHPIRATLFRRRFWNPAVERAGLAPLRIHDLRTQLCRCDRGWGQPEADRHPGGSHQCLGRPRPLWPPAAAA